MNSKTASKARIYLYNEENIIKKITYIYDDGSESKPLKGKTAEIKPYSTDNIK